MAWLAAALLLLELSLASAVAPAACSAEPGACDADGEADEVAALQLSRGRGAKLTTDAQLEQLERDVEQFDAEGVPWHCPFLPKYQTLREPAVVESPVTLNVLPLKVCDVSPGLFGRVQWFYTRAYALPGHEPTIPGPTIKIKPGDTLNMTIHNMLEYPSPNCTQTGPSNYDARGGINQTAKFCYVNDTNMHVHGLHVTPMGIGDNIFSAWPPGSVNTLSVALPPDHASGTNWYHAHRHHATSDQAGGGMFGGIAVEDPPGLVPNEIARLPTKLLALSLIDMQINSGFAIERFATSPIIENLTQGNLWRNQTGGLAYRDDRVYLLVNGMWKPSIWVENLGWTRLNMIYGAIEYNVVVRAVPEERRSLRNGFHCEFQLLAKDGLYLSTAPRHIDVIYLASGNRANVAMRCGCREGYRGPCAGRLVSVPASAAPPSSGGLLQEEDAPTAEDLPDGPPQRSTSGAFANCGQATLNQSFLLIKVKPTLLPVRKTPLPTFSAARPCYLVDLRGVNVSAEHKGAISIPNAQEPTSPQWEVLYWSNYTTPFEYSGTPWGTSVFYPKSGFENDPPPALQNWTVGTVQEMNFSYNPINFNGTGSAGIPNPSSNPAFDITTLQAHPVHLHVSHYQIVALRCNNGTLLYEGSCDPDEYYRVGDWHDTLMQSGGAAIVRLQLDRFTGHWVLHCHILSHEDGGMMTYFNVSGVEGTRWPVAKAKAIDPTCYDGPFTPQPPSSG